MVLLKRDNAGRQTQDVASLPLELELEYERALGRATSVIIHENCRLSKVSQLLAEHEKEVLFTELEDIKAELRNMGTRSSHAEQQLQRAQSGIVQLHGLLRTRSREVRSLKGKNSSLEAVAAQLANAKAKRVSLMREISKLRMDASQLRLQNSSHQSVIPESTPQRQADLLELEFQTQKHTVERTRPKDPRPGRVLTFQNGYLASPQHQEISIKSHAREKLERRFKSESDQRTALEKELNELRTELAEARKTAKDPPGGPSLEIPDSSDRCQVDLKEKLRDHGRLPALPGFRSQLTIATPGGAGLPQKPKKRPALPGDVSSFSVTPFLNRATLDPSAPDITSDETENSSQPEDHGSELLETSHDASNYVEASSLLVPTLSTLTTAKASNQRIQGNRGNYMSINRHRTQSGAILGSQAIGEKKPQKFVKKQRILGSKRERALFDSGEDIGNYGRTEIIESGDGRKHRMEKLPFSPLKRRIRPS